MHMHRWARFHCTPGSPSHFRTPSLHRGVPTGSSQVSPVLPYLPVGGRLKLTLFSSSQRPTWTPLPSRGTPGAPPGRTCTGRGALAGAHERAPTHVTCGGGSGRGGPQGLLPPVSLGVRPRLAGRLPAWRSSAGSRRAALPAKRVADLEGGLPFLGVGGPHMQLPLRGLEGAGGGGCVEAGPWLLCACRLTARAPRQPRRLSSRAQRQGRWPGQP